jgi:hypothetical protein
LHLSTRTIPNQHFNPIFGLSRRCRGWSPDAELATNGKKIYQLISNFRRVLNVVCFLLGNSPASEFYMPTFRNTLFHLHGQVGVE